MISNGDDGIVFGFLHVVESKHDVVERCALCGGFGYALCRIQDV
jgi:hypothetical protein